VKKNVKKFGLYYKHVYIWIMLINIKTTNTMETKHEVNEFSHEDGLKTIYAMIESAKGNIGENYLYYLLWGYLVAFTCILEFVLIRVVHYNRHYLVWPVLMGLGLLVSVLFMWRQKRKLTHMTFIGSVMGYLWGGWILGFMILLFFINTRQHYGDILPVTMVMYGLGIFVSGGVIGFRPLIVGGLIAFAAALMAFYQDHDVQLLITASTVILSYIAPGHMLRRASKKQKP